MGKYKIIILILILVVVGAGFYYKGNILSAIWRIYSNLDENIQKFEKTDVGNIIAEFKKEILAPSPLNVGGKENQVVLIKAKIIAQTNIQRYNNGLFLPLIENAQLNKAAQAKAQDMFLNQYFEHVSPSGVDSGELVKSYGYEYIITGENLILGNFFSEEELVQNWMDSPGHRANILNSRFTDIGVAVVKGVYNGQTTWIGVQEFGLPFSACSEPSQDLKNEIDNYKNQLDQLSLQLDAKKSEIDQTNPRSEKYNQLIDEYNQLVSQYNQLAQNTKNLILQYNNQTNIFNRCVAGQ